MIADEQGRYVDANRKAEMMTGYSREELLQLSIADLTPGDGSKIASSVYEEFKRTGQMSGEYQILRKDGKTVDTEYSATRLGPGRYLSILQDITSRKKLQEALQESERRYRTLVETSKDLIWSLNTHGRLTFINQASREILGYDPEELIGKHFSDLLPVEDRSKGIDFVNGILQSGSRLLNHENRMLTKDGTILPVRINAAVLCDSSGRISELTGISRDISEEKRAEEFILLQLKEKETLLQEVHHRSKNNLQIISSLLKLQMNGLPDPIVQVLRDAQGRIQTMALLHQMLYSSENVSQINFGSYISDLIKKIQSTFGGHLQTTIQIDCEEISIPIQKAITAGLVVNEIISNAFKYAFPDGKPGELRITVHKNNKMIRLMIGDNGIGLPENRRTTGSLGLRLIDSLGKQLGAEIQIVRDRGTAYIINFPED